MWNKCFFFFLTFFLVLALATFFLSVSLEFFFFPKHKFALFDPTFHILEGIVANILSSLPVSLDQKNLSHRVPYELSNSNMGCFQITYFKKNWVELTVEIPRKKVLLIFSVNHKKQSHARCYKEMCLFDSVARNDFEKNVDEL